MHVEWVREEDLETVDGRLSGFLTVAMRRSGWNRDS